MTSTDSDIEELDGLKRAASERRARRAKPESKRGVSTTPATGIAEDGGESPPSPSETEEPGHKLVDQVETLFGEIGEASRERPALALVSAFAVGILVGHLFSKR